MEDEGKSRKQLLRELAQLRRKVAELATSEAERKRAEEALASYRDGLEELVEERTSRLMEASARLEEELAERKRAEETLAAERNLLRTLMDSLPDPVFVKDAEGRYLATNPAHARVVGLASPQQVVGKRDLDLFPEELVRRYFHADDQHVLRSGEPLLNREQMVIDADGQERWFLTSKVPLRDAGGSVVGLVAVGRDITERKQAEERIRDLARFPSENPNPVLRVSLDGDVVYANQAGRVLMESWGRQVGQAVPQEWLHGLQGSLQNESPTTLEFGVGDQTFSFTFAPVAGRDYVNVYGLDITEHKRAEETLRESEQRYRQLFQGVDDAVIVFNSRGEAVDCNDVALRRLGYSREEFSRLKLSDIVHPEYHVVMRDRMPKVLAGETTVVEAAHRRKDGRSFPIEANARRIEYQGQPAILAVVRDITERTRARQALEHYSQRLEEMVEERTRELQEAQEELLRSEKLALLGEVAGAMSHELRNPLGAIKNAVYYLNMVLEAPDTEVRDTLDILNLEVGNCARIVQDLLDFARSRPPVRVQIQVNDTVRGTLSDIPVPEGVEVVTELDEGLPPIVADAIQLNQVFGNIITNAFQAMPQGGRLLIRSRAAEGEGVAISFADTGVGIPEENLGRMFEPLFTTKAKGIGLGLAAVRLLVERHGGKVEAVSELGRGSTFTVWLPVGGAASGVLGGTR